MDSKQFQLPPMLTGQFLNEQLQILPEYSQDIRSKSQAERLIALQDLYRIFIPNQMTREIYTKLYLSLYQSMIKKQSIIATRQANENSKRLREETYESIIGGSDSFTVIGTSGIGKSSSVSRATRLLSTNNYVCIQNCKVIPCLTVQTPADASVKGLLLEILRKIDECLNTAYHETALHRRHTTDMLIATVSSVALNHIGILIIDEIQNIANSKNGKVIVGTLTQLINSSGIAICMVGTPESSIFFEQAQMLARRSVGLSYKEMEYGDEYRDFCKRLLSFVYVINEPEITEGMLLWIYNHTNGNASITVSLLHDAQEIAILNGSEKIDEYTLNQAFEKRLAMLHGFIRSEKLQGLPVKKKKTQIQVVKEPENDKEEIFAAGLKRMKNHGDDIVSFLKNHGINILEVEI